MLLLLPGRNAYHFDGKAILLPEIKLQEECSATAERWRLRNPTDRFATALHVPDAEPGVYGYLKVQAACSGARPMTSACQQRLGGSPTAAAASTSGRHAPVIVSEARRRQRLARVLAPPAVGQWARLGCSSSRSGALLSSSSSAALLLGWRQSAALRIGLPEGGRVRLRPSASASDNSSSSGGESGTSTGGSSNSAGGSGSGGEPPAERPPQAPKSSELFSSWLVEEEGFGAANRQILQLHSGG